MFGNGAKILRMIFIMTNQRTSKTTAILHGQMVVDLVIYCAVVLGKTIRWAVAPQFGKRTALSTVTSLSVFVWLFLRSGIPFPLLIQCRRRGLVSKSPKISNSQPNSPKISTLITELTIPHSRFNIVE